MLKKEKKKEKETKHKPYPLKYYKFDTQDNNETWEMKLVIIIIILGMELIIHNGSIRIPRFPHLMEQSKNFEQILVLMSISL